MAQSGAGAARRGAAFGLPALALCALLLAAAPAAAQQADARVDYVRSREFHIPFGGADPRISAIRLYVSEDQGRTWAYRAEAQPAKGHKFFIFNAPRDGWYWFAAQTIDNVGQANPPNVVNGQTPANSKICVDTAPPRVTLQATSAPAGQVAVRWEVQDDNLANLKQNKAGSLVLEYRAAGGGAGWAAVNADARAVGQASWNVTGSGPFEVRLRATDDAGNVGDGSATVTPGGAGGGSVTTGGGDPPPPPVAPAKRRFTNSRRVNLKYNLEDVGKSGVAVVEVWNTSDGKTWQLLQPWKDIPKDFGKPLAAPLAVPLTFEKEGLFGFTLIARSGVGRGQAPPNPGDEPQIWIEADWTKPVVKLRAVDVGRGADEGYLLISWSAEDKNIDRADRCVTLSYSVNGKDDWKPFAQDLPNDGFFKWKMDEQTVPFQFYVKVEAQDKAGNVGEAKTADLVKVDLKQPKANVLEIEPVKVP